MGKFKVTDQDNYEPAVPAPLDQEDIVDRESYIDPQEQIKNMIRAGERLAEYRSGEFDTMEGDAEEDPTRNKDFDIVDAQRSIENLNSKPIVLRDDKKEVKKEEPQKEDK